MTRSLPTKEILRVGEMKTKEERIDEPSSAEGRGLLAVSLSDSDCVGGEREQETAKSRNFVKQEMIFHQHSRI